MTNIEKKIAARLNNCSFLPGSFDKRFVKQLSNWDDREMTERGRATMLMLFTKYRRQIPDYERLSEEYNRQP